MKLTVNTKDLLKKLQEVGGIIKSPNQMPILDNVLFILTPGNLQVVADNLEIRTTTEMNVDFTENYSVCVPHQLLVSTLKGFPNTPVDLVFEEKLLSIQAISGNAINGEYKLPVFAAEEFPSNKSELAGAGITFNSLDFVEALKKISGYIDEKSMNGLSNLLVWITEDGTKVVGGHSNLIYEISLPVSGPEKKLLISRSVANYLNQSVTADEDLQVSYNDNHVFFALEGRQISAIQGNIAFPPYQKLFEFWDDKITKIWKVEPETFTPALKRICNLTDQHNYSLSFAFNGNQLEMSFRHMNEGTNAREVVTVDYEGDPLLIGLSAKDIPTVLNSLTGPIEIKMGEDNGGVIITGENTRCVSMPMILGPKKADAKKEAVA